MTSLFALLKWPDEDYLYSYTGDASRPFEDVCLDLDSETLVRPPHQIEAFCVENAIVLNKDSKKPWAYRFEVVDPAIRVAFALRFKL